MADATPAVAYASEIGKSSFINIKLRKMFNKEVKKINFANISGFPFAEKVEINKPTREAGNMIRERIDKDNVEGK